MNAVIDNGQLTLCFGESAIGRNGPGSGHKDGLRVQLYWPKIVTKNYNGENRNHKSLMVRFDTCLRLVVEQGYWGIGGELFGFGGAIDYQKRHVSARDRLDQDTKQ